MACTLPCRSAICIRCCWRCSSWRRGIAEDKLLVQEARDCVLLLPTDRDYRDSLEAGLSNIWLNLRLAEILLSVSETVLHLAERQLEETWRARSLPGI